MRKLSVVLLVAAVAGCARGPGLPKKAGSDAALELAGAVEGGPYFLEPAELARLPQRTVRGVDPQTGRTATWQGTALHELFDRVKLRRGADTLVVWTTDGEAIPIPIWKFLEMRPVLADRADGTALPDRVLAWPNVEQPGLETDPRSREWWARRISKLEVQDWERSFGKALRPPAGANDEARLGAGQFGLRCVACHQLRGIGGTKGPELTRAGDRLDARRFAAAVERHPHFAGDVGRRADAPAMQVVDQVWAFLRALARAGPPVAEEPEEPEPKDREDPQAGPTGRPHARR
jgi:mono/diheme cytochrome c family protein